MIFCTCADSQLRMPKIIICPRSRMAFGALFPPPPTPIGMRLVSWDDHHVIKRSCHRELH